jgi:hypothetical protein
MRRAVLCELVILLLALAGSTSTRAQTTLNLSRDLVTLGIAATNMAPNQPSLDAGPLLTAGIEYAKAHQIGRVVADPGSYYFLTLGCPYCHVALFGVDNITIDFQGRTRFHPSSPGRHLPGLQQQHGRSTRIYDCNRADGVGSRFFNVTTATNLVAGETQARVPSALRLTATSHAALPESDAPVTVAKGYGELPLVVDPGLAGSRTTDVNQGERVEVRLPHGFDTAYQLGPAGQARALPTGSTWDAAGRTFSWHPAPGFLGRYRIVFSDGRQRISVRIVIVP